MPIYEFKCNACGHAFSELRKMGDFKAQCPQCQSSKTEKLMSAFASHSSSHQCSHSGGG
ncbi:MAG: zinc ribbon domain-containing protein [Spirochaetae bacterium HGW-Spirochaetae-1]|nr:MAG: zinc ribbon domain-containing protein [Spirochaetae bacterium HGW-Spirochaetae-1]